jgi:hypothetical protein
MKFLLSVFLQRALQDFDVGKACKELQKQKQKKPHISRSSKKHNFYFFPWRKTKK